MSHFFTLVLLPMGTRDIKAAVQAALSPYQENNSEDCPPQYLKFNDMEPEYRAKWEESIERVRSEDGSLVSGYDERFRVPGEFGIGSGTHAAPATLERVQVPLKTLYPTFDAFMREYAGYSLDSKTGRYGYWENPNAKWDWYSIGGRYTGRLGSYDPETDPLNYEMCWLCDGTGSRRDTNYPAGSDGDWSRTGSKIHPSIGRGCNGCRGAGVMLKFPTKFENHGNIAPVSELPDGFSCFAILSPEGEWIERGQMGWWGCVSNEKDDTVWKRDIRTVLDKFRDSVAVGVDCHI